MARLSPNAQSQVQVDDGYLIALAKQGDHTSYERLVRRYYGFVRLKASSYFLAGVDENDTYWFSGVCLLRVAVFTAVMICRVMHSSAKLRKLDSRSER